MACMLSKSNFDPELFPAIIKLKETGEAGKSQRGGASSG